MDYWRNSDTILNRWKPEIDLTEEEVYWKKASGLIRIVRLS